MLSYVAREFAELSQARDNPNARRLALYASILERMVDDLRAERPDGAASLNLG